MLGTKDVFVFLLIDAEEKELLLEVEHLTNMILGVDLVLSQSLHNFFEVIDVLDYKWFVARNDLVAVQENYCSLWISECLRL